MEYQTNPANVQYYAQQAEEMLSYERDNIDTHDLCRNISAELSGRNIPQGLFAARIINRSQGTLSDLLAKPKPWHILRSGRQTYTRMYNWFCQPYEVRMAILYGQPVGEVDGAASSPSQKNQNKRKSSSGQGEQAAKKQRLVFTEVQKNTLEKIFEETQRPDKKMQQMIADTLRLDVSTVYNYFMNNRRRSNAAKAAQEQNYRQ